MQAQARRELVAYATGTHPKMLESYYSIKSWSELKSWHEKHQPQIENFEELFKLYHLEAKKKK